MFRAPSQAVDVARASPKYPAQCSHHHNGDDTGDNIDDDGQVVVVAHLITAW